MELCRGLLSLVQEKVASDALRLLYDDALFCHLVEEVLQFEKELRGNLSYPTVLPGLLHLLLESTVLQKWLIVEKKSKVDSRDIYNTRRHVLRKRVVVCSGSGEDGCHAVV